MENDKKEWDPSQLRKYDLDLEQILRLSCKDPRIDDLIANHKPVVITDSKLIKSAEKWDLQYLEEHMGNANYTVYISKDHKFKYYDHERVVKNIFDKAFDFTPPIKIVDMKFRDYLKRLRDWKEGEERLYLQHSLNITTGREIVRDFLNFNWEFCESIQEKNNWGPLTKNLLLVSMEGNVTPCHYDEQENLFAQAYGYKRCILFPPSQFECLYPYPLIHPHDRQSMVDFERPNYERFPKFREAKGYETVLGPGEVLHIPSLWWHQIEVLMNGGHTVSVNFWYKSSSGKSISYPLKDHQKVTIMRNLEKMLYDVLQDPKEVPPLLRAMVLGRYTE